MSEKKEYIERGAAIELVKSTCWTGAIHALNIMPAADVEPVVRGEWKQHQLIDWKFFKCTNCGETISGFPMYKYCHSCGAHMERSGSGE